MIKLQNLLLLFLPLMLLAGCHEPAVEGKWLQPVPGMAEIGRASCRERV